MILPGSKHTASDLAWLRESGIADVILQRTRAEQPVLGICGGCQMLGHSIEDSHSVESSAAIVPGLGLLPLRTRFERTKVTAQVRFVARKPSFQTGSVPPGAELVGYEIHMGNIRWTPARRRRLRSKSCSDTRGPSGSRAAP